MLTIEPRMDIISEHVVHMFVWYPFLEPRLITYDLNISLGLR